MLFAIIGGGASGFMAAVTAAETFPGARVIIFEKSREVLSKVRISGGGRCNVTHNPSKPALFSKNYPRGSRFVKETLAQFDAHQTIQWFESRGVPLKTEPDGRVFPVSDNSGSIIYCLMENARNAGVEIRTSTNITGLTSQDEKLILHFQDGSTLAADRVVVATGGSPKLQGLNWLMDLGHEAETPVPSLFTFNTPDNYLLPLTGVSVSKVTVRVANSSLQSEGPILITHWGFSGPAILRLSAWGARELAEKNYQFQIRINWTSNRNFDEVRQSLYDLKQTYPKQQLAAHPQYELPSRLWRAISENTGIQRDLKLADTPHKLLNKLAMQLTDGTFAVAGKTTFKEEFVTCGGIRLDQINPSTMESRKIKGLFFTGELLDVDGITGGFNFQHAWTSGYIAGKNLGN